MSLFTFFRAAPGLFESFGFVKEQPVFMSIVLFQLLQGPLDEVSYSEPVLLLAATERVLRIKSYVCITVQPTRN